MTAIGVPLFWDAGNTNNGGTIDPGSGSWSTPNTILNWNNGSGNVPWTQTSTTVGTMGAIFNGPDAAPATYQVTVDGGQVAATNLTINANGYTFTGSPIYLNTGVLPLLMVANGVSVTFSNNLAGNNATAELRLGDNGPASTMVLYGTVTGWQPLFTSTNGSVVYLANTTVNPSSSGTAHIDADVRMTNGTWNSSGAFVVGRRVATSQPNNGTGVFTLDGPNTVFNQNNDYLSVGRDSVWNSTVIVQNGATLNDQVNATGGNPGIGIPRPGSSGANNQSWMKVYGGTVNMGTSGRMMPIYLANGGSRAGQVSVLTQTGGVINAWAGIQFGGTGTYDGGTAALTNSGGFLYLGANGGDGLRAGTLLAPTNKIVFSGGTIGALQSWHAPSTLPIFLDTLNGNITFQCADSFGSSFNISLDEVLSGPGGFNKSGGGQLNLSGVNTYAGTTVISNGMLQLTTSLAASSNGPVILDGSAGSPELVLKVSNQGQYWSVGTMTFASGSPTIDFQYGQITPSSTVASINVTGDVNYTVTPTVLLSSATKLLTGGVYPLIRYTGTASGTPPATATLPGYATGYLSNSVSTKTLYLVITAGASADLVWSACNGSWDTTTGSIWKNNGSFVLYSDGNPVVFDDSAPCTNATVTLNTTLSPSDVTFNNLTNSYTLVGNGNLNTSPSGNLELLGGGTVTLTTTNTFTGGTAVSSGSLLNINKGGSTNGSPVGTGTLTLNANARLGNTSGSTVALQYPVQGQWNGSFSYVGNNDLNLGSGAINLAESTTVNVVTNSLIIEGPISDGGNAKQLTKSGNGILTFVGNNSWNSLQLQAGQLNLNSGGAAGSGFVTILGGSVDNTSGGDVALSASAYHMSGMAPGSTFAILGTGNLDFGSAIIDANNGGLTFNVVSNTWSTAGLQSGNSLLTKAGIGTWRLGGFDAVNNAIVTVNQGEFDLARGGGNTGIGTGGAGSYGGSHGLVVNSNAVAKLMSPANQISHGGNGYVEVILNTGVLDLNGNDQGVDMIHMTNGVVRNSAATTSQTLTVAGTGGNHPTNAITLSGANCQFDVPPSDASLNINSLINGDGSLVKTGLGTVTLQQSNNCTGNLTVSAGTLSLTYPDIAPTASVTVATNAVLNLNFANSDTNIVAALTLNGANAAAGVHNAGTDPLYLTGTGSLLVVPLPTINPNPGVLLVSSFGPNISLAWPTNAGWILLTNAVRLNATNAWYPYPGSVSLTNITFPISPSASNVFYRLQRP
jgi:autotransporter-associated beta strand protein